MPVKLTRRGHFISTNASPPQVQTNQSPKTETLSLQYWVRGWPEWAHRNLSEKCALYICSKTISTKWVLTLYKIMVGGCTCLSQRTKYMKACYFYIMDPALQIMPLLTCSKTTLITLQIRSSDSIESTYFLYKMVVSNTGVGPICRGNVTGDDMCVYIYIT